MNQMKAMPAKGISISAMESWLAPASTQSIPADRSSGMAMRSNTRLVENSKLNRMPAAAAARGVVNRRNCFSTSALIINGPLL